VLFHLLLFHLFSLVQTRSVVRAKARYEADAMQGGVVTGSEVGVYVPAAFLSAGFEPRVDFRFQPSDGCSGHADAPGKPAMLLPAQQAGIADRDADPLEVCPCEQELAWFK
jgi:hypothetical protein